MSGAKDFLVELGTEELPPLALKELETSFADGIVKGLREAGIPHAANPDEFATPRRLAVLVRKVATSQPAQELKLKGPPVNAAFDQDGKPTQAASKFAGKCGVDVGSLARVTEGKGEFLYFVGSKPGVATASLLPGIVQKSLESLPIPKRMRWGSSTAEFVRPVHWLVMLFGSEVIRTRILDTESGAVTRGHRFMAPADLPLGEPAEYQARLFESGKVIADFGDRSKAISEQVKSLGREIGGDAIVDHALLDEVTALVEWPRAIAGKFDARFLDLPREVLISTLQRHQRYFPVEGADGKLLAHFITVANIESRDPAKVRAGNERVVRPRLSDAAFFWERDRKQPLAALRPALDAVTFQARLGSIGAKVERVTTLAREIAIIIDADAAHAARAAGLAKCDLLSAMVGEFPELQGTMGRYYATADGEAPEVAAAVEEHYLPRGAGDALPATGAGVALALADKLDTLAGIFSVGQKPSGTKDPFGLRRAAIGILRILVEKKLDLDLRVLVARACALQPVAVPAGTDQELWDYVLERLRPYLLDAANVGAVPGATTEMFDAVRASAPVSPLDFAARLGALVRFLGLPEAASLTAANKRISNILKKAQPGSESGALGDVDVALLREPAEKSLHEALAGILADLDRSLGRRDYGAALAKLATLRPPVDAFFDAVMVNAEDPALRRNRLALLARLRGSFARIADLSCLPG